MPQGTCSETRHSITRYRAGQLAECVSVASFNLDRMRASASPVTPAANSLLSGQQEVCLLTVIVVSWLMEAFVGEAAGITSYAVASEERMGMRET